MCAGITGVLDINALVHGCLLSAEPVFIDLSSLKNFLKVVEGLLVLLHFSINQSTQVRIHEVSRVMPDKRVETLQAL